MNHWRDPSSLDRAPLGRTEEQIDRAWSTGVVFPIDADGRMGARGGQPLALPPQDRRRPEDIYLGTHHGRAWFARPVERVEGETMTWWDVPEGAYDPLAAAVFLAKWHALAPLCERCGSSTVPDQGGARRQCTQCGWLAFPRMDPSIIVAITDPEDRLLLARNAAWPERRVSIIAGFMEAGESAEQACHREVFEEVGVRLTRLTYVSSQPWPMPRSLMLGFEARAVDSRIHVDGDEILAGAYHSRADLVAAVSSGEIVLPGGASIARQLIDRWLSRG